MDPLGEHDPQRVGPYRLLGRLGAGGMGQVFLGVDRRGELVAVKVVHPGLAHDEPFRLRFRREVEISRRVTGPWVAAVVDADPDARTPWLATQYVRGPSLGAAVETLGPLAAGTVHVLAHGLAIALAAVHEAGLVHRDLKPSNVLLGSDHPRLIDFGISRAIDGTRITSTGMVVGTPAFMSPEQIAGADVGTASDVFSLGSVLAYAATGRSPFGDHPPVVLMMRITSQEPDLDGLPVVLREPIAACLAKRPEDRPTATQLGRLLGAVAAGGPGWLPQEVAALGVAPDGPTVPVARTRVETPVDGAAGGGMARRLVLAAALGAGAVALGGGGALAVAALNAPAPPSEPPTPRVRWTVPVGDLGRRSSWAVDDSTLYSYSEQGVIRALDTANGNERWSGPGWARPEVSSDDDVTLIPVGGSLIIGAGAAVAALDPATGQRLWEVARQAVRPHVAVVDGIVLASVSDTVVALDAATGGQIWSSEPDMLGGVYARVAAGSGLAYLMRANQLQARDLRTGSLRWSVDLPGDDAILSTLLAGRDTMFAATRSSILAFDAASGQPRWSAPLTPEVLRGYFDLVGDLVVVYTGGPRSVHGLDARTGTERWVLPPSGSAIARPICADGVMYLLVNDGPMCAYDIGTGALRWTHGEYPYVPDPVAARAPDVYLLRDRELQAVTAP